MKLEYSKDSADRNTCVKVGRSVDGITHDDVFAIAGEDDGFVEFFRDKNFDFAAAPHGVDEDVIADHIELLLVVTSGVGGAGEADELYGRSASGSFSL